jgi:tetratricopeptide (TPR) repeat protein
MNKEIIKAIEEDNLVLFVGAGMSIPLGFPDWRNLIKKILQKLKVDFDKKRPIAFDYYIDNINSIDLFEILDELENKEVSEDVKDILYKEISKIVLTEEGLNRHKKLWSISDKIITTNYDKALDESKPKLIEVFESDNTFQQAKSIKGAPFLYKIHGDITDPLKCILFSSEYTKLYDEKNPNTATLRNILLNKTILFIGFSLEDPFVVNQIKLIQKLYNTSDFKHFVISKSNKYYDELNIESLKIDNWEKSFDEFLNKLIDIKKDKTKEPKTESEVINIDKIKDIIVLQSIFNEKSEIFKNVDGEKKSKITKELYRISDRISELHTKKIEFDFQELIPNHNEQKLEYLFESIFSSEKISHKNIELINSIRNTDNSEKYKWYHRSVIVSALTCSLINHKDIDPRKIDLLIDFTNDSEEKVWQKAISYLFLVLNHLGNRWLKYKHLIPKLERLKNNTKIQEALKEIIQIMQFGIHSNSFFHKEIFKNPYFNENGFNYFLPFYEGNSSVEKLYEKENIEDIEDYINNLYNIPLPAATKYFICNTNSDEKKKKEFKNKEVIELINMGLYLNKIFEPYLNHINTILNFYKNYPSLEIDLKNEVKIVSVNNFKKHLLDSKQQHEAYGRHFIVNQQWEKAIKHYQSLIELDSKNEAALVNLSICYERSKRNSEKQLEVAFKIEALNPKNHKNLNLIGCLHYYDDNYKESLKYLNRAILLYDKNPEYFMDRAKCKCFKDDYKGAEEDLNMAINLKTDDIDVYYYLGLVKDNQENYDEAMIQYRKMIAKDKNNTNALNGIANILRKTGDISEAHRIIDKAIKKEPKEGAFYGTKAAVYASANDEDNFYFYFDKALSLEAKASSLHADVKLKYSLDIRFKEILQKHEQTL